MSCDVPHLDLSSVPLFPLPGVVLFPRAVLPLHVFEERYRTMTADALAGDRLIAMALLKPGWEKHYYGRPEVEPVVCVGQILSHEKLADGKYNFLLQGVVPARIVREHETRPYRRAQLQPLEITSLQESDLAAERRRMADLFLSTPLGGLSTGRQFRQLVKSHVSTSDLSYLVAFTFLDDVELKQSLLEERDTRRRVDRTLDALQELVASLPPHPIGYALGAVDPTLN